jgi:hypothetical protein
MSKTYIDFRAMKSERNRFASFGAGNFPYDVPFAMDLAKFGFFSHNGSQTVYCAFCRMKIDRFEPGDSAYEEHKKAAPSCPFILGLPVGNQSLTGFHPTQIPGHEFNIPSPHSPPSPAQDMNSECDRLATFPFKLKSKEGWDVDWSEPFGMEFAEDLAKCGFYYIGGCAVKCHFCNIRLHNFKRGENALDEHRKWSPHCPLINGLPTQNQPIGDQMLAATIANPWKFWIGKSKENAREMQAEDMEVG